MSQDSLLEKFRLELLKRGPAGIKSIGCYFRQIDDDGSKSLSLNEFQEGILNHKIDLNKQEINELFRLFDKDCSGKIGYEEFLLAVRPPLNNARLSLISQAFDKMDKTKDGKISIDDLKGIYNAKKHPKFLSGEMTEEEVFQNFLESFEASQHKDGIVTREEFVLYYSGVSASIDEDEYFEAMMKKSWKL